jgi:hypothetical protein
LSFGRHGHWHATGQGPIGRGTILAGLLAVATAAVAVPAAGGTRAGGEYRAGGGRQLRALPPPWWTGNCQKLPPPQQDIVPVSTAAELAAAVAALRPGQTILLADGTYDLVQTIHLRGELHDVAVRGASGDPEAVVLRGRGMANADYGDVPHGMLISDGQDILIADLTIRDVFYHAVQVQGERGVRGVRIYRTRLLDAGEQLVKVSTAGPPGPYGDDGEVACSEIGYTDRAPSSYTNGVDVLAGARWVVRDNLFRRIRAPQGGLAGPAVLFWRNAQDTLVERNLFVDCDRGIAFGLSAPDTRMARDAESVFDHQRGTARNNMIYRAGGNGGDIGISANYASDFRILHNTVVLNGTFPWGAIEYRFTPSRGEIRGNLTDAPIWRRDGALAALSDNLVDAQAAWFDDPLSADLHLAPSALPAIDGASSLADVPDDFDGDRRPFGPRPDVGADERVPAPTEPTPTAGAWPTRSLYFPLCGP